MTAELDPESGFLQQLGQRVRTMRALRGMSRKVLAKVSGISERYIAQLESGKGNVSIVLLRRVSNAMGAHLEDLIPSSEPAPDWQVIRDLLRKATPSQIAQVRAVLADTEISTRSRMPSAGIALIGLRGAGKSTLGKLLAKKIGWSFVELNKEIEQQNGLSVAEIIALYGQEGFRRMEQAALGQLLARQELAQGRAGRTYGAGAPSGRFAPDGRRSLGDGGVTQYPGQPRAALRARLCRGRHRGPHGRRCRHATDGYGYADASQRRASARATPRGIVIPHRSGAV
jgi:transcriptional regulator with XRE-family HTH domain